MSFDRKYLILGILFGAYALCYLDRMVMATAIPFMAKEYTLSPLQMGSVLSAFFVGYAFMQIPGGLLADRFGPRVVLAGSISWFSLMTALTAGAWALAPLLAIRALFGLGEGPFPPAASKATATWFAATEVGRANGTQLAATGVGATLAPLFVVALVSRWGWRSVFLVLSVPGALMALLVWRFFRKAPALDLGDTASSSRAPLPEFIALRHSLLESLRTPAIRWCAASLFLANIVAWGLLNWLPTYLLQDRGFNPEKMGVFAAITNFAGALGYPLGGYICDKYFPTDSRVMIVIGLLASAGCTYLAAIAPTGELAVLFLVLVFLLSSATFTAIFTVPLLVMPKHAVGAAFGVVNTAGQLSGVLAPVLVGLILNITGGSFQVVLYSMVALALFAIVPALRIRRNVLLT